MESGLNGRLDSVTLQLQRMPQKSREMSDTTASARIPDPGATSDQSFEKELPHVGKVETADSGETQKTLTEFRRCNCAKILRRQTKSFWTSTWSLSWSDSTTSHHLKTCQYWNPYQEVWTTKLSVSHVNLLAAMALSASIRISKQAGFFSISPSLTLRGVVNGSSPAFTLLKDLESFYHGSLSGTYRVRITKLEKQTSMLNRSLLRLLKERAVSPYEVDEHGRTLLHYASSCTNSEYAVDKVPAFRELIHTLLDAGVAINEVDLVGETAFDYLTSRWRVFSPKYCQRKSVCELVANNGAEMSDVLLTRSGVDAFQILVELQHVAMLGPWQDVTQCGPLSRAVLRKSEQDVIRILRAKPSSIHELNRRKQNPLHLAYCWPRGIQLLLDAGANHLVHQADVCGMLPITYSTEILCPNAIQLLLDAGSALSWPGLVESEDTLLNSLGWWDTIPSFVLSTLQERRRKLFELAKHTLPAEVWADLDVPTDRLLDERAAEIQRILIDADIEIPKSISVPQRRMTVYHDSIYYVNQADQLWDAGFRDIDSQDEFGHTPLMRFTQFHGLHFVPWLLHHGADPHQEIRYDHNNDKRKPVASLTQLHVVARNLGDLLMRFIRQDSLALRVVDGRSLILEKLVVESDRRDDCHCACSSSGCTPFTILLKPIHENGRKLSKLRKLLVHHLESPGHPASSAPMRSKIVEDCIRFETFEALQLSHTCCDFYRDTTCRRYTPEEVREIHEEWEELLSKHEDLVSEFCHKFKELGGTLTSFLKGYWQTRMDEVLQEERVLDEEDIRRLREMGVVLEEVSEEVSGESEEDFLDEDFTDEDLTDEDVTDEDQSEGSNEEEEEHDEGI